MKRLITSLTVLFFSQLTFSQYSWFQQNGPNGSLEFIDIQMMNNFEGWTVGGYSGNAYAMRTLDGSTWGIMGVPSNEVSLVAVVVNSNDDVYVLSDDSDVWHTTDAGLNWTQSLDEPSNSVYAYNMTKAGGRVVITRDSEIMYTDNGTTWSTVSVPLTGAVRGISFDPGNDQHGWICGNWGGLAYTNNAGASWTSVTAPTSYTTTDLYAIQCVGNNEFWCVGSNGALFYTDDGGLSWVEPSAGIAENLLDINFHNGTHGITVGANNTCYYTENGGSTWTAQPANPSSAHFNSVQATNEFTAFMVGGNGEVWSSPTGADIGMVEYIGPTTVCAGQPFDFTFVFQNVGTGVTSDESFNAIANTTGIIGFPATYNGVTGIGEYDTLTVSITLGVGDNDIYLFSQNSVNGANNFLDTVITGVLPDPTDVLGSTFFCPGDTVELEASGGLSYIWQNGDVAGETTAIVEANPTIDFKYVVEITQAYCVVEDTVEVYLEPNCDDGTVDSVGVSPRDSYAFSPNYDGKNDVLVLDFLTDDPVNTVNIYNRWGDEVYQTIGYNNADNAWDGMYEGKESSPGTYFFVAQTSQNGVVRGWVQLVK